MSIAQKRTGVNICECGHVFYDDEIEIYHEYHGFQDCPERFYLCPRCGSGEFYPADRCRKCWEWFKADDIVDGLCPNCGGVDDDEQ